MVFLKTKVWCIRLSTESDRIPNYKKDTDKPHHKLLHCF